MDKPAAPTARLIAAFCLGLLCVVAESPAAADLITRLDPNMAVKDPGGEWLWHDATALRVEGKGWADTEKAWHRLPARARGVVRDPVWSLGTHSAGICVAFTTNARKIGARWTLSSDSLAMPHMPATGVSGLDLYVNVNGVWRWIGNGRPSDKTSQAVLADGIPEGTHEYLLYLPLYNGVDTLEVGVPPEADLAPAPARPAGMDKPVVFYGTSITQGGCASRPGMAYPALIGRRLDRPTLNLGFSGNGKAEPEVAQLLAELDPAVFVLDPLPNLQHTEIRERLPAFVTTLRAARPLTPIILVENIVYQGSWLVAGRAKRWQDSNQALRTVHEALVRDGMPDLHLIEGAALLGDDDEATVDGTHPTDVGFLRMADAMTPILRQVL